MKHFFLYIVLIGMSCFAHAQSDVSRIKTSGQVWAEANFNHVLKPKYVFEFDVYANSSNNSSNTANIFTHFTQYGLRVWLHYYYKPRIKFSGGTGIWQSRDVGELNQIGTKEYRISAQGTYILVKPGINIHGRIRADERIIQDTSDRRSYNTSTRFLFIPKVVIPLNSKIIREHVVYLLAQDEMVFNLNQKGIINRNTAKIAVGYGFTKSVSLELGYEYQLNFTPSSPTYETNALSIALTMNNISNFFDAK